jgi:hypothetical protein
MRRAVAALALVLAITLAQAQTLSAIGTVITVGQWIVLNTKRVYYIEVDSRGDTFEDAKNEAFRRSRGFIFGNSSSYLLKAVLKKWPFLPSSI